MPRKAIIASSCIQALSFFLCLASCSRDERRIRPAKKAEAERSPGLQEVGRSKQEKRGKKKLADEEAEEQDAHPLPVVPSPIHLACGSLHQNSNDVPSVAGRLGGWLAGRAGQASLDAARGGRSSQNGKGYLFKLFYPLVGQQPTSHCCRCCSMPTSRRFTASSVHRCFFFLGLLRSIEP